jgi:hypothetical protein
VAWDATHFFILSSLSMCSTLPPVSRLVEGIVAGLTYQADAKVLCFVGLEMMGRKSVSTLAPCDKLMVFLLPRNCLQENRKERREELTGLLWSGVGEGAKYYIRQGNATSRSQDLRGGANMVA